MQQSHDREARGDNRYGSDWLIAKNHDTFAPMGPFITPREFVPDPKNLPVTFTLNGLKIGQDATGITSWLPRARKPRRPPGAAWSRARLR